MLFTESHYLEKNDNGFIQISGISIKYISIKDMIIPLMQVYLPVNYELHLYKGHCDGVQLLMVAHLLC